MKLLCSRRARCLTGFCGVLLLVQSAAAEPPCASRGDGNGDCRISLEDHADFAACLSGPVAPAALECLCYDMDSNGSVDLADARHFQSLFTGVSLIAGCVLEEQTEAPGTLQPQRRGFPEKTHWSIPNSPASDTVRLFSGEFHLTETDLVIRGRGFDFDWTRCYRSKIGPNTAMGNGWDHTYNIHLEPSGDNLILHDGGGRSDEYCRNAGGTWSHPEYFREIVQIPGGYQLITHDRAIWTFNGFSGAPTDGRLTTLADRYGNSMTFEYDAVLGRLTTIHDTLSSPVNARAITIAYNPDGFIQSVTDFTGRQVTYTYYQDPEAGGGFGDLKSVTTPAVVGTPHGNDFPAGKTTVFTYSEGFADPRLNHNLLGITDPKGQTYLVNTFAATVNPGDLEFDRVVAQQLGLPGEQLFFHYLLQAPAAANNYATSLCIVNDRVGNVEECAYDHRNRLTLQRRYTGRANPAAPTTDVLNRPVAPLRPGDPPYFETRYAYNDESLLTRVVAPEGDQIRLRYQSDVDYFAAPRRRVELVERRRTPGPRGGAQAEIVESYVHDAVLNADTGQLTLAVDGRGNATTFEYDVNGNRTRTIAPLPAIVEEYEYNAFGQITRRRHPDNGAGHQREDEFTYYPPAAGPLHGYRESEIIDAGGLALTTTYEYDSVGNVTRLIDPRGYDVLYTFNQRDQLVRTRSREVVLGGGLRYEALHYYDANDNLVRIDFENRDVNGAPAVNAYFTTAFQYEVLNNITRRIEEVSTGLNAVTEFVYDANRNTIAVRLGEATNGNQPTNVLSASYDERDLLYQVTRAPGDPNASTTQYDYDRNGSLAREIQGLQGMTPRETTFAYDGYNRLTVRADMLGNESLRAYDASDNLVSVLELGEQIDIPGGAGNVRLSETLYTYDPFNRLTVREVQFFDAAQAPLTDGASTTTYIYAPSSHLLQVSDDNNHASGCNYDSLNRPDVCTDAQGNSVRYTYDANSNITAIESTEKSDLGLPDEVFTDTFAYDGLNRLTIIADNLGNARQMRYDSRDLVGEEIDALGNLTSYAYDGLMRVTQIGRVLTDTGDGGGVVVGMVTTIQVWDDSSRLIAQTDSHGNSTTYTYDPLNRLVNIGYADGTAESYGYDVHDNPIIHVDANGTQVNILYDLLNRPVTKSVAAAAGVSNDTTFELFTYDGLGRLVIAEDDDSVVIRVYDSLSHVVTETQNGMPTTTAFDGVGNPAQCVYPNGRIVSRTFDALDRLSSVADAAGPIADFAYVGPERLQSRGLANGAQTTCAYDGITGIPNRPGDFGVRQPALILHDQPLLGMPIDIREFRWDPQYNRKTRMNALGTLEHTYAYDSAYRLTRTVLSDVTPPAPTVVRDTHYQLDLNGNRNLVLDDNCPGAYTLNPANPPSDFQMNQYSTTGCDDRTYDNNGNLRQRVTPVAVVRYIYDYKDRLVLHTDLATGASTRMAYDALDRRISQEVTTGGLASLTEYYYDGPNVIQEQEGATTTTYVHGERLDELIQMQRGASEYYYHGDDLGSVFALTDSNGLVVERYEYQDFGQPEFFDGGGAPRTGSAFGNAYLFTGRRYDSSTGLYYYRHRYLDPIAGRFITRDPLGVWADPSSSGSGHTYVGSNPWTHTDPLGLMNKAELIDAIARERVRPRHRGHVTVLKARDMGTDDVLVCGDTDHLLSAGVCPTARPVRCPDGSCRASGADCPAPAPRRDMNRGIRGSTNGVLRHRGHVTVLKMADGGGDGGFLECWPTAWGLNAASGAGDYNSSRSNNFNLFAPPPDATSDPWALVSSAAGGATDYNSSRSNNFNVFAPPPDSSGGPQARACRACGSSSCGGNCVYCVACGGRPCRMTSGCGAGTWKSHAGGGHHGHVTVLKLAGHAGGGGGDVNKAKACQVCGRKDCSGYHVLPAANNVGSR